MLEAVTARNAEANLAHLPAAARAGRRARYFAGGWEGLPALLHGAGLAGTYDAVLTAETLYCPGSQRALYEAILQVLPKQGSLQGSHPVLRPSAPGLPTTAEGEDLQALPWQGPPHVAVQRSAEAPHCRHACIGPLAADAARPRARALHGLTCSHDNSCR